MPAALNDSYLDIIRTENDPVFLINPDAGISAEIALQHFYFAIGALITISHDVFQQLVYFSKLPSPPASFHTLSMLPTAIKDSA